MPAPFLDLGVLGSQVEPLFEENKILKSMEADLVSKMGSREQEMRNIVRRGHNQNAKGPSEEFL